MSAEDFYTSLTEQDKMTLAQALEEWRKQNEQSS